MSDYFLSDVHLRDDRPERGRRLVRFLEGLAPTDQLTIAGDLCDFWMGSRKSPDELAKVDALRSLVAFRESGGSLNVLAGNHDNWLVPFFADRLGATILTEPVLVRSYGLRLHIVHGHLLGARRKWKAAMESRAFFRGFGMLPGLAAGAMDRLLEAKNQRGLEADELRHLAVYKDYAAKLQDVDVAVFGHVHRAIDIPGSPRLIVLGGWQRRVSYLKVDETVASFQIHDGDSDDLHSASDPGRSRNEPSSTAI